jgi:hypothetical protein
MLMDKMELLKNKNIIQSDFFKHVIQERGYKQMVGDFQRLVKNVVWERRKALCQCLAFQYIPTKT